MLTMCGATGAIFLRVLPVLRRYSLIAHHSEPRYADSLTLLLLFCGESLSQVSKILWADAFTQPLVKVLDFPNRLKQYILAPFAKTQVPRHAVCQYVCTPLALH